MPKIPATKFKAQCLELMDRVAERHESYVITKHGRPVAELVPVKQERKDSIFGWLRSRGTIQGDILNPVMEPAEWEGVAQWDEYNDASGRHASAMRSLCRKKRNRR